MKSSSLGRAALSAALMAAALSVTAPAGAYLQEIASCDQNFPVLGKAKLTRDLDCSGAVLPNIVIDRGTLDLNGHTLVAGSNYGVFCSGNCKIVGPGVITGDGSGVGGGKGVSIRNVDIAVSSIGAAAGGGKIKLDHVTITGAVIGAIGDTGAKIVDSTIMASVGGVFSGGTNAGEPCDKGSLLLRRSSVTGANPANCVGADPPANCVDVISCKRPKLSASTCGMSCQAGTGAPCTSWGLCSSD